MTPDIYMFSFYISLVFAGTILYLIRKQKLKEQYALLWLLLSLMMMVLSLFPSILDHVARLIRIEYAPSLLYLLSVIGILFILLHLTMIVSSLSQRNVVLIQTVALQDRKLQELIKQTELLEQKAQMERSVLLEIFEAEDLSPQADQAKPAIEVNR
ncbi:DUF2304 domain-containing protein [Paenibacillus sp. 1001270B_150601_E10]|uniref:DUF2304 domain-containing protein n=1 Tax=Paenibacillus sp. 1001270B_150601_E10 TaxID=2787079 RepID=UPI00189E5023|nr:DUF2304 domain-containing protein [Paenibacillus sp. 1001270B_150601_E10]